MPNGKPGAKPTPATKEFVPTEEQILRELKQREKRKEYMTTPKALENRKKYMKKRYVETKAIKSAIADMKEKDPEAYARLMQKAKVGK